MNNKTRTNIKQNGTAGIPQVLQLSHLEKVSEVIPVKLQPSLAQYIRTHGGSTLMREAVMSYLSEKASDP